MASEIDEVLQETLGFPPDQAFRKGRPELESPVLRTITGPSFPDIIPKLTSISHSLLEAHLRLPSSRVLLPPRFLAGGEGAEGG